MKAKKMIVKTVYCLAGLLFLISIGYNILQYKQSKTFSKKSVTEKITKTESGGDLSNSPMGSKTSMIGVDSDSETGKSGTDEDNELEYHLNAAKEELDMTKEQLSQELSQKEEFIKAYYQPSRSNSDPAYKKIRRDAYTKQINEGYAPLFKKLNISAEEIDELKGIMFDRLIELDDLSEPYLNASTAEEKEKVLQQERDIAGKYKDRIVEFLGEEKNEIYQSYEERRSERIRLSGFMETVSPGKRINEEQTESLIDSMYEARVAVYDEMSSLPQIASSSDLTEERIEQITKINARVNEKYVEISRGTMTPEQAEQYNAYLKQQLEIQEASLKMSLYLNDEDKGDE